MFTVVDGAESFQPAQGNVTIMSMNMMVAARGHVQQVADAVFMSGADFVGLQVHHCYYFYYSIIAVTIISHVLCPAPTSVAAASYLPSLLSLFFVFTEIFFVFTEIFFLVFTEM